MEDRLRHVVRALGLKTRFLPLGAVTSISVTITMKPRFSCVLLGRLVGLMSSL